MSIRGTYTKSGDLLPLFPPGSVRRFAVASAAAWVEVPLPEACDGFVLAIPGGTRRVLFATSVDLDLQDGAAVLPSHLERTATLPANVYTWGAPGSVRFFLCLDPGDARQDVEASASCSVIRALEAVA